MRGVDRRSLATKREGGVEGGGRGTAGEVGIHRPRVVAKQHKNVARRPRSALNDIINILCYLYDKEKRSTEKRNSLKPPDGAHYKSKFIHKILLNK